MFRTSSTTNLLPVLKGNTALPPADQPIPWRSPFPRVFIQVFENASLDALLQEHEKALVYFEQRFEVKPLEPDRPCGT